MLINPEQQWCWGIRQKREIEGLPYSLIVSMYSREVSESVVTAEATKLLLEYKSSVDIIELKLGKNYRVYLDNQVLSCRYGIFDQSIRQRLTVSE
jgi:hypothetical protein